VKRVLAWLIAHPWAIITGLVAMLLSILRRSPRKPAKVTPGERQAQMETIDARRKLEEERINGQVESELERIDHLGNDALLDDARATVDRAGRAKGRPPNV